MSYDEIDEDLIPAFKCVKCKANVCKDEVGLRASALSPSIREMGYSCVCINCYLKEKEE